MSVHGSWSNAIVHTTVRGDFKAKDAHASATNMACYWHNFKQRNQDYSRKQA